MSRNYYFISLLILPFFVSSLCFAQPQSSDPNRPANFYAEKRKLKNWWEEPTAAASLGLEAEQVSKLVELQKEFSTATTANSAALKERETLLGKAILAGDENEVTAIKKAMLELISTDAAGQIEFKTNGLALLNKQQLQTLASKYPEVLDKRWGIRTKGLTKPKRAGKGQRGAKLKYVNKAVEPDKEQENSDSQ